VKAQLCSGGIVTLTCTATPNTGITYQWYLDGTPVAGANAATYNATSHGNYSCRVTIISTGCFKDSKQVGVTISCMALELNKSLKTVTFFPNPSRGYFVINTTNLDPNTVIDIYDASGKLMESTRVYGAETKVGGRLAPGSYIAKIELHGQPIQVLKLVKISN